MKNFILCKPNRKTLCVLNGVQLDSVSYTPKLNDLDEIAFTVDRYIIDDDGNKIISQGYDQIHAFMEVYIDGIGYFQIKEPQVSNDGNKETKSVTGVSTDCELLQKDLVGFTVNKTTANSLEMLADNNVNSLGYPNEYITFYNSSNPQLSLMDLVLEKTVGWKVGFIDESLKNQRFVFDDINENILSFLTKTLSSTAKCIFEFNTADKTVSAYSENNIGEDTGIIIAYRNLLNNVDMSCNSDNIFTRLNVQGRDSLTFSDINYGDTHVSNLDYYKNTNYMDDKLIAKLDMWEQARNDNREDYISKVKIYHDYIEQISEIDNKVPTNGVLNNWDNMSMDELTKNQTYYNSLIKSFQITAQNTHPQGSETIYTGNLDDYSPSRLNPDGTVDHEAYMADLDGQGKETYREIITYVLPNIQIAIDNFDKTAAEKSDYLTGYLTEWDLYGIVELKAKQSSYEEQLNTLKNYVKNWSDLTDEEKASHGNNQDNYELYHNEYIKIDGYLSEITSKFTELDTQKQSLITSRDVVQSELKQIRTDMAMTGGRIVDGVYTNWFSDDEVELINLLFHDTDYTNENILTTSLDDFNKQLEIEQELYDDAVAQLDELSIPQYSFSCELDNLLDIEEFKEWKDDFKVGNFITLEVSPNCFTKLRLISISYNPCIKTNDLTVEFSNMVTTKSGRNDFSYIFDKAISVAKNSITYSNNSNKDSIELSTELLNLLSNSSVFQGKFDNLELNTLLSNEIQVVKLTADYAKINELETKYATIDFANITEAAIDKLKTTSLFADYIKADEIETTYLKTNFANIDNANIDIANIGILFNKVGLIDRATIVDGHITGYLDAVEINANNITAGTLIADRILLKAPVGSERNGLLYAINNLGELSSSSVDTIDGYVLTERTINADKIVASSITTNELDVNQIFANSAVLAKLTAQDAFIEAISTNSIVVDASSKINNLEIGGVNLLLNTKPFAMASSTSLSGALLSGLPISNGNYYRGFLIRGNTIISSVTEVCRYNFTDFGLGDTFTFSFYAKGDVTELRAFFYGASGCVQVAKCVNSQGEVNTNSDGRCSFAVSDGWGRYWVTWTLKSTGDTSVPKYVMIRTNNAVSGQTVYVCGCKLEKGNKITDWTPAVEDTETAISEASIANWCYNNNKTYIDGAKIYTGSINADKIIANSITTNELNVNEIFANSAVLSTLTAQQAFINAISTNTVIVSASQQASKALDVAEIANENANKSINGITIHYLSTSSSSGVTINTAGWTTTPQSMTSDKKYLWTYQTMTDIAGNSTNSTPVISGVYGDTGDTGVSVTKAIPLYYASNSTTAPIAPTSAVTSTSTSANVWTTIQPAFNKTYPYIYVCTQVGFSNNTYSWSNVTIERSLSQMANWCSANDVTLLDGGKIYTGSITADKIKAGSLTISSFGEDALTTIQGYSTTAIDEMEIGGINILLNTKSFNTASSTTLNGALLSGAADLSDETYYGLSVRGGTLTTTQMDVCRYNFKYFDLGDTFTFSFFARGNVNELRVFFYGYTGYVQVAKCTNSQGETNTNADGRCSFKVSDGWKRYWARWTLKTTGDTTIPKWILIRAYNSQIGQEIYVCGCKLEKGNKATDWSPSPEDASSAIMEASIANWCYNNNTTYIDGGKIYTGTVTAEKIATDAIKSINYVANTSGSFLNLSDGSFDSKYFKVGSDGSVTATNGTIGGWEFNSGYLCKKLVSGSTESDDRYVYINTELSTQDANGDQSNTPRGRIIGVNTSLEGRRDQISATNGALYINADGSIYSADLTNSFRLESGRLRLTNIITGGTVADGEYMCSVDGGTLQFCKLSDGKQPKTGFLYLGEMGNHLAGMLGIRGVKGLCSDTEDINILTGGNLILRGSQITSSQPITVASDARAKNHIDSLPKGSENLFDYLDGKSFFYNNSVSTQKSYGFIAQDVLSALTSAGLTTDDFAGFCDINGDGSQYALAYEQFIPIMWNEIKRLRNQVKELKGEL